MDMKLKPCPFCGRELRFFSEMEGSHRVQYWMHEYDDSLPFSEQCLLDQMFIPFSIGAGDARPEEGYVGEYGLLWNKRAEGGVE